MNTSFLKSHSFFLLWSIAALLLVLPQIGLASPPPGFVSVKASPYNAKGDGSTNDTFAFRQCLLQNDRVWIPPGLYILSSLPIGDNKTLRGAGIDISILKYRNGGPSLPVLKNADFSNHFITIEDLTIDGNRHTQSISGDGNSMGIRFDNSRNCTVRHVKIVDCGTDGLHLGANENTASNYNQYFNAIDVNVQNSRRNGVSVISARNCSFTDCIFNGSYGVTPEGGIDLEPDAPPFPLTDIVFTNCQTNGNNGTGFNIYLNVSDGADSFVITCINHSSVNNGKWGYRVGRINETAANSGMIRLIDCEAINNDDIGFMLNAVTKNPPRVKLIRPYAENNCLGGSLVDTEGTRAHIKLWSPWYSPDNPGGIDIEDAVIHETFADIYALAIVSDAAPEKPHDDVVIKNLSYTNTVGNNFWKIDQGKRLTITGATDANFRHKTEKNSKTLNYTYHSTIINNLGATQDVVLTLPPAKSRTEEFLVITAEVATARKITLQAQGGDTIIDRGDSMSSSTIGHRVSLENAADGEWIVKTNQGFVGSSQ